MQYWNCNQTCIISNCDAIYYHGNLHAGGGWVSTHKLSHKHTVVRFGKTLYIGCHGITTVYECASRVADTRTAYVHVNYMYTTLMDMRVWAAGIRIH